MQAWLIQRAAAAGKAWEGELSVYSPRRSGSRYVYAGARSLVRVSDHPPVNGAGAVYEVRLGGDVSSACRRVVAAVFNGG